MTILITLLLSLSFLLVVLLPLLIELRLDLLAPLEMLLRLPCVVLSGPICDANSQSLQGSTLCADLST